MTIKSDAKAEAEESQKIAKELRDSSIILNERLAEVVKSLNLLCGILQKGLDKDVL